MKKTISLVLVFALGLAAEVTKADFIFGEPTNLRPLVSTASNKEHAPFVSADGLSLYFNSNRPGAFGRGDIWVTTRQTVDDLWGEPVNLGPTVNTEHGENHPEISADGLELYFDSDRPGGYGVKDIWVATRETKDDDWGRPVNLGPPVNSPTHEISPSISANGLELYFSDYHPPELARPGGYGWSDIWVTTRPTKDAPWGEPVNLGPVVNSPSQDARPNLSPNGLLLLFDSQRDVTYGDLYIARRRTLSDPWGTPVSLGPIVNSSDFEESPSISPDGTTLLFDRVIVSTNSSDIWQAPVIPIVDLNGDGIVDSDDTRIMIDYWHTNESLCDIGPTPFGDGVVDAQDLIVLAEHLFEDVNDPTLVAHWALDETEGDVASDSAQDNDGTVYGNPAWQPEGGIVDGALQLDGIDDYVSTPFVLNPADGKFSVFAWIKGGAPGQAVLSQMGGANWILADASEGKLMTELKAAGRGATELLSQTIITDGNWHRIGLVWDGSNRTLYVDDIAVAEDEQTNLAASDNGLYIGAGTAMEPGSFWSGLIDDVRIYNRPVSP